MPLAALLPLIAMTLSTPTLQAQELSPEEGEVWGAVEAGWRALAAEEVDGFIDTLHPDFLGWSMQGEAPLDLAAERSGTERFLARYDWVRYAIEPVAIRIVGDDAVVHYRYQEVVRDTEGGAVHEVTGRATQVMRRGGGRWRTLTIMSGPVPE